MEKYYPNWDPDGLPENTTYGDLAMLKLIIDFVERLQDEDEDEDEDDDDSLEGPLGSWIQGFLGGLSIAEKNFLLQEEADIGLQLLSTCDVPQLEGCGMRASETPNEMLHNLGLKAMKPLLPAACVACCKIMVDACGAGVLWKRVVPEETMCVMEALHKRPSILMQLLEYGGPRLLQAHGGKTMLNMANSSEGRSAALWISLRLFLEAASATDELLCVDLLLTKPDDVIGLTDDDDIERDGDDVTVLTLCTAAQDEESEDSGALALAAFARSHFDRFAESACTGDSSGAAEYLFKAAHSGYTNIARYLIQEAGLEILTRTSDSGLTAVMVAALKNRSVFVDAMHEIGAEKAAHWPNCSAFAPQIGSDICLKNCGLSSFPPGLEMAGTLSTIDLSHNALTELPDSINQLQRLKVLVCAHNMLRLIPALACRELEVIDMSSNRLERLPIESIVQLPRLVALHCQNNSRLCSPPPEIAQLGGEATVEYLKTAALNGRFNCCIQLIAVGNGESGKTSVIQALMKGKSIKIHEDQRTVGIDLKRWILAGVASGLIFESKDLAGQAVYALTNQFFLVPRALYMLVWRAVSEAADSEEREQQIFEMVSSWMDALQLRVPGAFVLIVVTHIDCVTSGELEAQCARVKQVVAHKLQVLHEEDKDATIPPLTVWRDGDSFRVNCLEGDGVDALKENLIQMAHSLPWWREVIPRQYVDLQEAVAAKQAAEAKWLSWSEYVALAEESGFNRESFGNHATMHLRIATSYLHENASIKYFGNFDTVQTRINEAKTVLLEESLAVAAVADEEKHEKSSSGIITIGRAMSVLQDLGAAQEDVRQCLEEQFISSSSIIRSKRRNDFRVLALGLDGVGKTSILNMLKLGEVVATNPTIGFNVEEIFHNDTQFTWWDLGGGQAMRASWRYYTNNTDALIFVVDSNDIDRLSEARRVLHGIFKEKEQDLREAVLLVLANKQDLPNAVPLNRIIDELVLHSFAQKWHILPSCALSGDSLHEGMDWLCQQLQPSSAVTTATGSGVLDKERTISKDSFIEIGLKVVGLQRLDLDHLLSAVDNSVFTDSKWIIDGLKGLIRHDRHSLMTYFGQMEESDLQRTFLRRVDRLAVVGILHEELVPFIWPRGSTDMSIKYWQWARLQDEGALWDADVAGSNGGYDRIKALLTGCDIIHRISETEYVAPGLLANKQQGKVDARVLEAQSSCTISRNLFFSGFPPGFFDRLMIRCRRKYSHMDFTANSVALYGRGLKAQLFVKSEKATRRVHLKMLASTHKQIEDIIQDLNHLCRFFRGMRKIADDGETPDQRGSDEKLRWEPIQVRILSAQPSLEKAIESSGLGSDVLALLHAEGIGTAEKFLGKATQSAVLPSQSSTLMRKLSKRKSSVAMNKKPGVDLLAQISEVTDNAIVDSSTTAHRTWKEVSWAEMRVSWTRYWSIVGICDEHDWTLLQQAWAGTIALSEVPGEIGQNQWSDLSNTCQFAAKQLGFDSIRWNNRNKNACLVPMFADPWRSFAWPSLPPEYKKLWGQLGYTEDRWQCEGPMPTGSWGDLKDAEQHAAVELGYSELLWSKRENPESVPPAAQRVLDLRSRLGLSAKSAMLTEAQLTKLSEIKDQLSCNVGERLKSCLTKLDSRSLSQHQILTIEAGRGPVEQERLRVVLVCLDPHLAGTDVAKYAEELHTNGLVMLPVLCPGFQVKNYGCWWPADMPWWKHHALFFDARDIPSVATQTLVHALVKFVRPKHFDTVALRFVLKRLKIDKLDSSTSTLPKGDKALRRRIDDLDEDLPGFRDLLVEAKGDMPSLKQVTQGAKLTAREQLLVKEMTYMMLHDHRREARATALLSTLLAEVEAVRDRWFAKVQSQLLAQVNKFLEEWRGRAPDPSAFAQVSDRLVCVPCSQASGTIAEPHFFSREECEATMDAWRALMNQQRDACRTAPTHPAHPQGRQLPKYQQQDLELLDAASVPQEEPSEPTAVCVHGHTSSVSEILSRGVIFEAVPCPACVQHGDLPPFCFNRKDCLLFFSEDALNTTRKGAMECRQCAARARPSSIRILDIIVPEVFISYNWGVFDQTTSTYSTQAIVQPLRSRIEDRADVVCWFDVGGGMGAGQSHLAEMEEGVRKCTVVVIFISDAYCNSPNCLREFLHAISHSKYLIPVLVPNAGDTRTGPSGWSGPGEHDKDWWRHASRICTTACPDTGAAVSWTALAKFAPIDLRPAYAADVTDHEARRLRVGAELEIVKRISSRFHRGYHAIDHSAQTKYDSWRKAALFEAVASTTRDDALALFNSIDSDHDGKISKSELIKGYPHLSNSMASVLLAEADADFDGFLDFDELWGVINALQQTQA